MKLKSLKIKDYRQFKDIEFDFTYPKGHKKEGLPLDKVCFIGQSGTGKTTLLKAVKEFIFPEFFDHYSNEKYLIEGHTKHRDIFLESEDSIISATTAFKSLELDLMSNFEGSGSGHLSDNGLIIIREDFASNKTVINAIKELRKQKIFGIFIPEGFKHYNRNISTIKTLIDLRFYSIQNIWDKLVNIINDYNAEITLKTAQLYNETKDADSKIRDKKFEELKIWQTNNPNPLLNIAKAVLDEILEPLNLKVYTELTVDIIKGEFKIPIRQKETGELIHFDLLSSGSQNIIYPSLLFYFTKPNDAIIMFDEVENSLFPDIQRIIIDHYTKLAPNNQFFYATHSPIIASSFEPCERFILFFDEEGYVQAKQGVAPQGDDPNDLLKKDFGMENLMLDTGIEKYHEYLNLKTQVRNEKDEKKKKELMLKMTEIGEAYNF